MQADTTDQERKNVAQQSLNISPMHQDTTRNSQMRKSIRYGHPQGRSCLRETTSALSELTARKYISFYLQDIMGRLCEDEDEDAEPQMESPNRIPGPAFINPPRGLLFCEYFQDHKAADSEQLSIPQTSMDSVTGHLVKLVTVAKLSRTDTWRRAALDSVTSHTGPVAKLVKLTTYV